MKLERDTRHIIIAGTTKAGTTSLFKHLANHPEVEPSTYKETRFFLDKEYPLSRKHVYDGKKETYHNYFLNLDKRFLLEATPDYLHSRGCAKKIKDTLGENVKLIFILRNPVDRFISWYNYAKQQGEIGNITLLEFLEMQKDEDEGKQIERVLLQGKYDIYLNEFKEHFEEKSIYEVQFEELVRDSNEALKGLYSFVGLKWDNRSLPLENPTIQTKQNTAHYIFVKYVSLKRKIRGWTHRYKLHILLSRINSIISTLYFSLNKENDDPKEVSQKERDLLKAYYEGNLTKKSDLI